MTRVVVAGALATKAGNAGNAWSRLGWIAGFGMLGCDCWFVERLPAADVPAGAADWFAAVVAAHGLADRAVLYGPDTTVVLGPPTDLGRLVHEADLVLDISGHLGPDVLAGRQGPAAFLDDDPGFTQAWAEAGLTGAGLDTYDVFLTYGTNIGRSGCPIPTLGHHWYPVLPPVALAAWPVVPLVHRRRFTTVGTWRGPFGPVTIAGTTHGLKVHEFRKFLDLPRTVAADFTLAMAIDPADTPDVERLRAAGWQIADPATVAATTSDYRRFIQSSAAEISAAQGVYIGTQSGWVSDRTACYLASGRPAAVQDTGLGIALPTGEGVLTFRDLDSARAAVEELRDRYEHHARAARKLAEEWFDATATARQVCAIAGVQL